MIYNNFQGSLLWFKDLNFLDTVVADLFPQGSLQGLARSGTVSCRRDRDVYVCDAEAKGVVLLPPE